MKSQRILFLCGSLHFIGLWVLLFALYFHDQFSRFDRAYPLTRAGSPSSHDPCAVDKSAVYFSERVVFEDGIYSGYFQVGGQGVILDTYRGEISSARSLANGKGLKLKDFGRYVISPGLIDTHVHVSAIGGRRWEGYDSATRAAVAGGTTTIVTMPLNSLPPTVTIAALNMETAEAISKDVKLFADVGYWGGGVPSNVDNGDLARLLKDKRVLGIKSFLSPLPPAAGYEAVSPEQLLRVARLAAAANVPLLVHCELMSVEEINTLHQAAIARNNSRSFLNYLATRPPEFERRAIGALIKILHAVPTLHAHIVHLSDAGSLPIIEEAKKSTNGRLTVETCPHYLFFDSQSIPDGETRAKCMPPIRDSENKMKLWDGLKTGAIDSITSDHSPCLPEMRKYDTGNFLEAWGGISGLQFNLASTWTAAKYMNFSPSDLAKWWSEAPAKLSGIWDRKGSIRSGKQADFVVWDPDAQTISDNVYHRHSGSPYVGVKMYGGVRETYLGGVEVFHYDEDEGPRHIESAYCGRIMTRHD